MRLEFRLPDPGEGLTEADIATWLVAPGDTVTVNQPVLEVETAKSLVELPSPWDGTVLELLAPEGATVVVGTPVFAVEVVDDDGAPVADGSADGVAAPGGSADRVTRSGGSADGVAAQGASADVAPATTDTHAGPHAPGGAGASGTESPGGETSGSVLVGYGTRAESGQGRRRIHRPDDGVHVPAGEVRHGVELASPEHDAAEARRVLAKPPVRMLAKTLGVDLTAVVGTGPGGIVTRDDLMAFKDASLAETYALYPGDEPWLVGGRVTPDGRRTRVPVRSVRKRTAEAMVASAFTAPHVSVTHTVDVSRPMEMLQRLRRDREFEGVKLTPLLFVMKALLIAVHRHPEINASWDEETQEIVYKHYVNLGIAASTPRGLVVPNIKDAHKLTLRELAVELADLTVTAREGKTTLADMSDGTITITNVGAFGIDTGTPILNPGEAAILAFGAIREQPWVRDGQLVAAPVTTLTLSFDHRLVDGELGALVLRDVCAVLEDPGRALVWS